MSYLDKYPIKRINQILLTTLFLLLYFGGSVNAQKKKSYEVLSPDNSIKMIISVDDKIQYSVIVDDETIIKSSPISMKLNDQDLGVHPKVSKVYRKSVDKKIIPVVHEKFKEIRDHYNELKISLKKDYAVIFRVYNNGVAYRFETNMNKMIEVVSEEATFNFAGGNAVYYPEEKGFQSHNERKYLYMELDTVSAGRLASLPVLVETKGTKVLIAESALRDYPGMWVLTGKQNALQATYPKYALEDKLSKKSDRNVLITKKANYIAKTNGKRNFPWRILVIAKTDADLITNQLVYQLGEKQKIKDTSWIKPGKVAWDWWNALNIYGVDFKSGVNTETYKYYIDFASKYGLEYIILDEGWYKLGNLMEVVPDINMEEIIAYGKQKNVGVILWVVWKTLDDQLEVAMNQFEKWGVNGIKVDFMQRDDQGIVNYYWKIAEEAAKRKMLVDFHGAYKPAGLRRAYPNVISREGVKGLENDKWSKDITPTHNLTIPFIRMATGPMDYTPGSMLNAQPRDFRINWIRPMSMGTRTHQIAQYVIYESPLQMLADSPSNYYAEPESTEFISRIPTEWDNTVVLEAKVGEYLVVARKRKNNWYIGGMTNETAREFTIDFSFIDNKTYTTDIMRDGINALKYASDYSKETRTITKKDSITIKLKKSGGWAAILVPNM